VPANLEHFLAFFPVASSNSFPPRFSPSVPTLRVTKFVKPSPELLGGRERADRGLASGPYSSLLASAYVRVALGNQENLVRSFGSL
jgi:hypothetical protein